MMRLSSLKWLSLILLFITALMFSPSRTTHAYYGGSGGLYGLGAGGLYGGLYGSYGLYGGLGQFSGLSGIPYYNWGYGSYGGSYGLGLYGSGLSGLYGGLGLYGSGLGGLYGGLGLYGLGSGLGGLYGGLLGLSSGLGGLYGGGLTGLSGLSGLNILGSLFSGFQDSTRASDVLLLAGTSGVPGLPGIGSGAFILPTTAAAPTVTVSIPVYPDPSGSYLGSWTSIYFTTSSSTGNVMTMNILYNPFDLTITGTAGLLLNKLIPVEIPVTGLNGPGFILTGTYIDPLSLETFALELTCTFSDVTLTLPAIIQGTYLIHDPLYNRIDGGTFAVGRL